MKLTNFFIKVDEFADYIPVFSTVTNLTNLFQKAAQQAEESNFCKNHYYTYIQQKNTLRCVMLLIPILGNIVVGMFDSLFDYGKSDPSFLGFAPYRVRNDKKIILAAVKNDGLALKYASKTLKGNKKIVRVAIENNSSALKYASEDLKSDKEIVLAAIEKDGWALVYASEDLKDNKEVVLKAVKRNGSAC